MRVESEKRFKWFTTEFSYRETILCYNQFHAVPLADYISQTELVGWIHHEVEKAPYPSPKIVSPFRKLHDVRRNGIPATSSRHILRYSQRA